MCTVAQNLVNIGENKGKIEGQIEGKIEGKIEGRVEERSDTIKNMINNGFTTDQISKFCGYDLDFVNEVANSLA
jgi:predicted transposase YdaD